MNTWICSNCREKVDSDFDACWNCGTHRDGSPARADFVRDDAPAPDVTRPVSRDLRCLRCNGTMHVVGRKQFHEGSRALPFLLGELGELFVNRESFDVFACGNCGKVELFVAAVGYPGAIES
ncbi:hypothetical protein [Luteimonas gilva]|uniref:hypothetical protein n=1 Tax=Luteimonas gilva TaxID=2572684 RepID=UPI001CB8CB16|nr:hypothetical protein [Luteimonas gilva]